MRIVVLTLLALALLWSVYYTGRRIERRNYRNTLDELEKARDTIKKVEFVALANQDIDPSQTIVIDTIRNHRKELL